MRLYSPLARVLAVVLALLNGALAIATEGTDLPVLLLAVAFAIYLTWWAASGYRVDPQPRIMTALRWCSLFAAAGGVASFFLIRAYPLALFFGALVLVPLAGAIGFAVGFLVPQVRYGSPGARA